jgi:hypothetical protein
MDLRKENDIQHLCINGHLLVFTENWTHQDPSSDIKLHGYSSTLYKMEWYLHITYVHPYIYFKLSLDYLHLI